MGKELIWGWCESSVAAKVRLIADRRGCGVSRVVSELCRRCVLDSAGRLYLLPDASNEQDRGAERGEHAGD